MSCQCCPDSNDLARRFERPHLPLHEARSNPNLNLHSNSNLTNSNQTRTRPHRFRQREERRRRGEGNDDRARRGVRARGWKSMSGWRPFSVGRGVFGKKAESSRFLALYLYVFVDWCRGIEQHRQLPLFLEGTPCFQIHQVVPGRHQEVPDRVLTTDRVARSTAPAFPTPRGVPSLHNDAVVLYVRTEAHDSSSERPGSSFAPERTSLFSDLVSRVLDGRAWQSVTMVSPEAKFSSSRIRHHAGHVRSTR